MDMNEVADVVKHMLALIGACTVPFTIYFAWKKIGHSASITYSTTFSHFSERKLTSLVITNNKDRPLPIYEIYAIIDKHYFMHVHKFDPPIILKGLECINVETEDVSQYVVGNTDHAPDIFHKPVEFYLSTTDKLVKCRVTSHPSFMTFHEFGDYVHISIIRSRFNGVVYNSNVRYAIAYCNDQKTTKTAFVTNWGFIGGEWGFRINTLRPEHMMSKETVRAALVSSGFDKMFIRFFVVDLSEDRLKAPVNEADIEMPVN